MVEAGTSSQKSPVRWWTRESERARALVERVRVLVYRVLDTVPPIRRSVDEIVRIELVDRSMAIGAQALLAVVPLLIVISAFLPEVSRAGIDHLQSVTGIGESGSELVNNTVTGTGSSSADAEAVRATTGFIGLLITLLSAGSFGRAVQRLYERVWEVPHVGGVAGLWRSTIWLFGWILALQAVTLVTSLGNHFDEATIGALFWVVRVLLTGAIWWWSMRMLLAWRVPWSSLAFPALLTSVVLAAYASGSRLVMPTYVKAGAQQFGTLGIVLAVATWLVGFAGIMVVCSTLGRVFVEDPFILAFRRSLGRRLGRTRLGAEYHRRHHGHEPVTEQPGAGDQHEQPQGALRADHQEASGDHAQHAADDVPDPALGRVRDQRAGQVGEPEQDQH
jgi:membrane protein